MTGLCAFVNIVALLITAIGRASLRRHQLPEQIQDAVKKAQDFLYSKQGNDGTWEQTSASGLLSTAGTNPLHLITAMRQVGRGLTAITVYSLLASGESPQSEKLKPAIEYSLAEGEPSVHLTALAVSSQESGLYSSRRRRRPR